MLLNLTRLLLLIILSASSVMAFAADGIMRVFSARDGLATSTVNDIQFDESGFAWVASEEGLYRVSNDTIRRIDKATGGVSVLDNANIRFITPVNQNHLLVTAGSSLYLYDIPKHEFTLLSLLSPEKTRFDIIAISEEENRLWLLNEQGERFIFDKLTLDLSVDNREPLSAKQQWRHHLMLSSGGELYTTADQVFWHSPQGQVFTLPAIANVSLIKGLLEDKQQRIWLYSNRGLYQLDLANRQWIEQTDFKYFIESMVEDDRGRFWLGTRQGLFEWDSATQIINEYRQPLKNKANIDYIHALSVDKHGLVWVGGSGDGIAIVAGQADFLTDIYSKNSQYKLPFDMVWSIYQQGEQVWLGSDGVLMLANTTEKTSQVLTFNGIENNDSIYGIYPIDDKHLLITSTNGLYIVNMQTLETMNFAQWTGGSDYLHGQAVTQLYPDPIYPTLFWFATTKGIFYWDYGNKIINKLDVSFNRSSENQPRIRAIYRDSQQRLWFGGEKVFGYVDKHNHWLSLANKLADANATISHINPVSEDVIWIGTRNHGFFEFNTRTQEIVALDKQFNIDCKAVMFLQNTPSEQLFGCTSGVYKYHRLSGKLTGYNFNDGFISDELNEGAKFYRPETGLFIGTPDGAMQVNLELLANRIQDSRVFLESVSVYYNDATELYLVPNQLSRIKPDADLISFQISTRNYIESRPLNLKYKLTKDGAKDEDYLLLDGQSQINIAGLTGGKYTLYLLDKQYGAWSTTPLEFKFTVDEFWWKSQTFKGLVLFSVLLTMLIVILYRHRQVSRFKKINQALINTDERLSQALKGSDSDLWEWQDATKILTLANRTGILGERDSIDVNIRQLPVHPDDKDRTSQAWLDLLKAKSALIDVEYRYLHENGDWRWLRVRGKAINIDPVTGRLLSAAGIYSDITLQRTLESEVNLLAEAFENTSEGMMILDADKKVKVSNLSASHILSQTESELAGRPFSEFVLSSAVPINIDKLFGDERFWSGERVLVSADGKQCPVWLNISKMLNNKGVVQHYVVVFSDITERKQSEQQLQHLATKDALTGLNNRTQFVTQLEQIIIEARSTSEKLALLFLDLDRFKNVNDSFGHSMGDELLVEAAKRIESCLTPDDIACRFGGDEFVLLLRNVEHIEYVSHVAQKILEQIETPFKIFGREFFISTSIGITFWPDDCKDPEMLIKNADLAMYHAKDEGRGNFQYYSAERNAEALYHLRLESDLRKAIDLAQFELHYQPQIDILSDDKFIGMEALIRWPHPEDGYIRPDIFIGVAEACGLVIDIDRWVLKQACSDGARWNQMYQQPFKMSVNVSAVHFRQNDFIEFIVATLKETGLPANCLSLEITEGVLMKELHVATEHLSRLKSLGIQVAIDDFGTGYSSLAYLRNFEVNTLKIDRSFLIHIAENRADQAIVSSIIELARNLKLQVIAEGIETNEQLEQVFSRGCYVIQGYYFAKPMPKDALDNYLQQHKFK